MKKSRTVLLSAAGALVGAIIIVAAMGRFGLSRLDPNAVDSRGRSGTASGPTVAQTYDLQGFRALDVEGAWRVSVSQGDEWQVRVDDPEGLEDEVEVTARGGELRLGRNRSGWWRRGDTPITADIVMPELVRLSSAGAIHLELSGFEGPRLELDIAGAVHLNGNAGAYDEINLSVAGASQIDLQGIVVTDARIDLAGASDITLTMNGGILSGSLAGAGSVDYYGSVAEQRVEIAGIGRISRLD